ncbi:thiamine phosphate synthase [Fodinisporobacter ferrooxydans]|uniref:Thiamine-phosphate synthase n=1 Tax=Fodinisporobacter ferrooxydans TaxID=2901836 RepID=A0ABY4CHC0_9BACL|nr:thiamine phosphate synthase [Alicyclobacillaceae bacterium MYW30-H2]
MKNNRSNESSHKQLQLRKQLQLYVVTDERTNGDELLPIIRSAMHGGATAVQLRRKQELGRKFVELGREIRNMTKEYGVLFFVNDRVDVAMLVDADGVHIGQDDISCKDARRLLPDKLIGVSADTIAEAVQAEKDGADYLGVGAVYATNSKPDAGYTGIAGLRAIASAVQIPVVGIGGIGKEQVQETMGTGAAGIAVVSAVMSAKDPEAAAKDLLTRIHRSVHP